MVTYAQHACETMMRKFKPQEFLPIRQFHYHQGVFLSGMYKLYEITHDEVYLQYIKDWVDSQIDPVGNINHFNPGQLDDLQPGVLLFPLYQKTGDIRYKHAMDTIAYYIWNFPRTPEGGYWHKAWYRNQMWLDSLYMGGPFSMHYALTFGQLQFIDAAVTQIQIMKKNTCDPHHHLWYHAWDFDREQKWTDPNTGRSPEIWSRSLGWVAIALADELELLSETSEHYVTLRDIVSELLHAVILYQDEAMGLWYQVIDKGSDPRNWLEFSGTCLFATAIYKTVRLGILDQQYLAAAKRATRGLLNRLFYEKNDLQVPDICIGTGVGDFEHYCARPTSINDLHGVGAFLMMCAEGIKCEKL